MKLKFYGFRRLDGTTIDFGVDFLMIAGETDQYLERLHQGRYIEGITQSSGYINVNSRSTQKYARIDFKL